MPELAQDSVAQKPLEKHFVSAGPYRICYAYARPKELNENTPRLLLVHGWIASQRLFSKVVAEIGQTCEVWAIDLPGFGDSDKPAPSASSNYDPPFFAEAIRHFADAVKLDKPFTLLGQSMGGIASTEFAARYPQRLSQLILLDSAGIPTPPPLLGRILQAPVIGPVLFKLLGGTRKSIGDFLRNDVYADPSSLSEEGLNDTIRCTNSPGGLDAAYAAMMNMVSPKAMTVFQNRFSDVKVPTHLIWGEKDKLFPVDLCAKKVESMIKANGTSVALHVIQGSGHEPPIEKPDVFIQTLYKAMNITR